MPQKQCSGSRLYIEITKETENGCEDWMSPSSYNSENKPDNHGIRGSLHHEDEENFNYSFNKVKLLPYKLQIAVEKINCQISIIVS